MSGLFTILAIWLYFRSRRVREIGISEEITFFGKYREQVPIWRIFAMTAVVIAKISTWQFYWLFVASILFRLLAQSDEARAHRWYKLAVAFDVAAIVAMWA